MPSDPSRDIMPVASPALPDRKRRRLIRDSLAHDPPGLAEPLYQLRHRDQVVVPSALDRVSRELLIRAQATISSALGPRTAAACPAASPGRDRVQGHRAGALRS